jgi:low temperature requirement protein LtrA
MPRIKRRTESGQDYSADLLELFFDLVSVFAITQVSLGVATTDGRRARLAR